MHGDAPYLGMEAPQDHQGLLEEEHAALDLFRRAREPGDERAREAMAQHWRGLLLSWLRRHPATRLALEYGPPERYVTAALNRFWQATTHSKRSSPRCAPLAACRREGSRGLTRRTSKAHLSQQRWVRLNRAWVQTEHRQ
jgi:hypothetical protein